MQDHPTRRNVIAGFTALTALGIPSLARADDNPLEALEREHGGRLGVYVIDTASNRTLAWRADERFLMCSTFKLVLVAAILTKVDAGRERLDRRVPYGEKDLLDYAPITRAHVADGGLSVEALCEAAIELSDNTAANLLLATIGGPPALTAYAKGLGDAAFRLDRIEPILNRPDGLLDTTTPSAMAGTMTEILTGTALSLASRDKLETWMGKSTPGLKRLRAGVPVNWRAGDKTGSGDTATNDLAIITPPGRLPLLVAAFYDTTGVDEPARDAVLPEVGKVVTSWYVAPL